MDEETMPKKSFNPILVVVVVIVLVVGGYFLFSNNQGQQDQATSVVPTVAEEVAADDSKAAVKEDSAMAKVQSFEVKGEPFAFTPSEIRVKKGDTVKITFTNTEGLHSYVIDEFNVKTKQLAAGESETVEFTADKVGTFEFYCGVGNHRQQGMVGNLIVEE